MRQVVLDTETTGLETRQGHRIIEIGALELIDRQLTGRQFHTYINPERDIEQGALEVHGITVSDFSAVHLVDGVCRWRRTGDPQRRFRCWIYRQRAFAERTRT